MNNRSHNFKIVIMKEDTSNNRIITADDILNYLESNISAIRFYAFIEHDCDDKKPHYHLVLVTYNEYSEKTIVNDIAKSLMCNIYCVQVQVSRYLVHDVRYLTHKDDYTKFQYVDRLIYTSKIEDYNDIAFKEIDIYNLTFDSLYMTVEDCKCDKIAIYSAIGLNNAKAYRNIIDEIITRIKRKKIQEFNDKLFKKGELHD